LKRGNGGFGEDNCPSPKNFDEENICLERRNTAKKLVHIKCKSGSIDRDLPRFGIIFEGNRGRE